MVLKSGFKTPKIKSIIYILSGSDKLYLYMKHNQLREPLLRAYHMSMGGDFIKQYTNGSN